MSIKKWQEFFVSFGWIVNGILYLLIIFMWLSIPDEKLLNMATTIFNLSLTIILIIANRMRFKTFYESPQFKKLTETIVNVSLVFFLISLLNYWAYKHPIQKDFSLYRLNSLTEQTQEILKKINGKLTFKMFARKNDTMLWMPILDLYRFSKSDIEIEKINIELRPDLVSQYNIQNEATLIVEYNGRMQTVTERDELNVTNAIVKLTRNVDPVIYFITGHDEASIDSTETEGMKLIIEAARNSALDIRPLNLLSGQEIPFDAKAVILWGPRKPLMDSEVGILKRFYERNGNLVIALDPDLNQNKFQNLEAFLATVGLQYDHNLIYDRKNFVNGSKGSVPIASSFDEKHILTKGFKGQIFFPLVSSVSALPNANDSGHEITELVKTTESDSWGETSKKEIATESVFYTEGADRPGPLAMAISSEKDQKRVLFFGNSTFALNAYVKFSGNMNFFLNSMSYAAGEDRLVSFNLPIIQSEQIFISENQLGAVFYFSVVFAPLLLIVFSIYIYRKKRIS